MDLDLATAALVIGALLALLTLGALVANASTAVTLVVIAALVALALDPLVERIAQRLRLRRGWAVALLCGLGTALVGGVIVAFGPATVDQARSFQDDLPQVLDQLGDIPIVGPVLVEYDIPGRVEEGLSELPSRLAGLGGELTDAAEAATAAIVVGLGLVVLLVALLIDGPRMTAGVLWLTPTPYRERVRSLGAIIYRVVGRYFAGSLVLAALQGLQVLVTGLVLGVPLSPLLALWAAAWNLIPQIGGAIGGVTFVLVAFTQGATVGVVAAAVFMGYLLLANNVLLPVIVGNAVDISPPTTMLAAIAGFSVGGVAGAMLAVPIVGASKAMYFELRPSAHHGDPRDGHDESTEVVDEVHARGGDAVRRPAGVGRLFGRAFRRGRTR